MAVESVLLDIAHDSDNLANRICKAGTHRGADANVLSDGILALEIRADKLLIDDEYGCRSVTVRNGKSSACDNWNAKRVEVVRGNRNVFFVTRRILALRRAADDIERKIRNDLSRQIDDSSGGVNSGESLKASCKFVYAQASSPLVETCSPEKEFLKVRTLRESKPGGV